MWDESKMKPRIKYLTVTLILIAIEVLIALFVHDRFVRPYLGDVLVVWVLYFAVRTVIPKKCRLLPLWVFLFAASVEVLQLFNYTDILGLGNIRFFRILMGSVFDIKDVICYLAGCIILTVHEVTGYVSNSHQKVK